MAQPENARKMAKLLKFYKLEMDTQGNPQEDLDALMVNLLSLKLRKGS